MIPKNIYQTIGGKKGDPLPEKVIKNIEFIKKQNPTYTHTLFRDDEIEIFIKNNYSKIILDIYLSINPEYGACRADLFRYLLINKVGGIYLDIKSAPYKPLDTFIKKDDEFIFSYWDRPTQKRLHGKKGEIQQFYIISIKNNPFLDIIIKKVVCNIVFYNKLLVGSKGVWQITGPVIYTNCIHKNLALYNFRIEKKIIQYQKFRHREVIISSHYSKLTTPIVIDKI